MPVTSERGKRGLFAATELPTAEIYLLDDQTNVVAYGVQSLSADLPFGVYKLRYRIGGRVTDKLVEVSPGDMPLTVEPPELSIRSPIPPSDHGVSADIVRAWREGLRVRDGSGSQILLCLSGPEASPPEAMQAASAVSLRSFSGDEIVRMSDVPSVAAGVASNIHVDPGSYLLRVDDGSSRAIEQTVYAARGWQTQVFVPLGHDETNDFWFPDLSECAVLMSLEGTGFNPSGTAVRQTEAARHALAARRASASSPTMLQHLLDSELTNPMLGIYAAHLMLLQDQPDRTVLKGIVNSLRRVIGKHPDVASIMLFLQDDEAPSLRFSTPPMLRSSWSLIVENSGKFEGLVPMGTYSARIVNLWGGGVWLGWRAPTPEQGHDAPRTDLQTAVDWSALVQSVTAASAQSTRPSLTPIEQALFQHISQLGLQLDFAKIMTTQADRERKLRPVWPTIRHMFPSELERAAQQSVEESLHPERLATALGIPFGAVREAVSELAQLLGVDRGASTLSKGLKKLGL